MSTITFHPVKSRGLLFKCLALSIVAHTAALTYFYFHPLILQNPLQSLFGITSVQPIPLENEETPLAKNHLLEEVFQKLVVLSPHFQAPYDSIELPKGIALAPNQESVDDAALIQQRQMALAKPPIKYASSAEPEITEIEELNIPPLFHPPEIGAPIASQLQIDSQGAIPEISLGAIPFTGQGEYEDLIALTTVSLDAVYQVQDSLNLAAQLPPPSNLKIDRDLNVKADSKAAATYAAKINLQEKKEETLAPLFIPKPAGTQVETREVELSCSFADLDDYDFSELPTPGEWNDDFDVDIAFLPNPDGKGYIFSLALSSNYDLSSHSLKQNLYFILDRSSSIQKHRFAVFKRAVLKALSSMQQGDTFNILVMDKKISKFRPQNCVASLKNIQAAEEFLEKQEAGGFFNTSDIYTALDKVLPLVPEDEEQHTAILLTDGKTKMNADRKRSVFRKWTEKNQGKLSLYACAIGTENDLLSLDMLCYLSGGELLYSDTHAAFPRKLAKLVLDLRDPVAKNLSVSAIPENPHAQIELYSANSQLSSLYSHQPYVIVGEIDEPCSFDLIVQGRHREEWIAIRKNISFIDGHKGNKSLEKAWDSEHAGTCYSQFLVDGVYKHLKEAKEFLKKSRSEVAFE